MLIGAREIRKSIFLCFSFVAANTMAAMEEARSFSGCLAKSAFSREQGDLRQSIETLTEAAKLAGDNNERARLSAELGTTLLQAHQYGLAEQRLKQAYADHQGADRARDALQLGNIALHHKQIPEARRYYQEVEHLAGADFPLRLAAALNLTRLSPDRERIALLMPLDAEIAKIADPLIRARLQVNLGTLAMGVGSVSLAYRNLDAARAELLPSGSSRLLVEAIDALAQLYEEQGRHTDAVRLDAEGLTHAGSLTSRTAADLRVRLEWRQGRLLKRTGQRESALAAYQRAVDQLETIRLALPIEDEDGRSTYDTTIDPLYMNLVDLLLDDVDTQSPAVQAARLRKARDVIELTRQAEMQDFLGDRCSVANIESGNASADLPSGTAVLYTILLPGHAELLLETARGIERRRVDVDGGALRATAKAFAEQLRLGAPGYQANARQLYDWLIRPIENALTRNQTRVLVIVPSDTLRLVAMGALHDSKQFLVEKYALVSATGLTMTQTDRANRSRIRSLVAGLSEPGPVVAKLGQILAPALGQTAAAKGIAADQAGMRTLHRDLLATDSMEAMKQALALPGVKEEVLAMGETLQGTLLLNEKFTVNRFSHEAETGDYRILHIASHGIFGGSAESSFILAYDDLLTLNGLEALLKSESFRRNPIEILSLSACQTAEGNARAPLGISGAAIKARARSVVGTLWPVEDISARILMERFYVGLGKEGLDKAEALRQAQLALLKMLPYQHPMFWAPFTLIGNWQ